MARVNLKPMMVPLLRIAVIVLLLGGAVGLFVLLVKTTPKPQVRDEQELRPEVTVVSPLTAEVGRQWRGYGTVRALDRADVPARVGSTVTAIGVGPDGEGSDQQGQWLEVGEYVVAGQRLVKLDPTDFIKQKAAAQARLEQLQAERRRLTAEGEQLRTRKELSDRLVAVARAEYDRVKDIVESGVGRQQDLDQRERELLTAQTTASQAAEAVETLAARVDAIESQITAQQREVEIAQLSIDRSTITSPIDGVLEAVDFEVGENVSPGQRVARVVGLDRVEVPLRLPASARGDVEVGSTVTVAPVRGGRPARTVTVARLSPINDEANRTFTIYAVAEQPGAAARFGADTRPSAVPPLLPGDFVSGSVTSTDVRPRRLLPRRSVRGGRATVVEGEQIASRPVDVAFDWQGRPDGAAVADDHWVVLGPTSGLADDAAVVVDAATSLSEGRAVVAIPARRPSPERQMTASGGGSGGGGG